ncbi:lytic polysaccharide monooxygenase [Photobacterium sp. TY1-4]|uniref:lytic polysaccharide monooxygenase n=1 Tax=Photobacterium sp. TY1-4 TaxID=2899122 RepID=UPI0021C05B12|nr:lytic polysaccharide monooxygenase [Photobacterium sp. TY1-4]UXI03123.1 lytic polysaccharide monooxygenase [Photobacterium sp. TY1-4]
MFWKSTLTLAASSISFILFSAQAQAHGWSEYPEARQQICYNQGGLWDSTPPNPACAQAKTISGSYPFIQRNEYSINIPDYNNMQAVRNAIPDGTLCYANDAQKKGMGAPHDGWTRTELNAGTFEYVFNATAPHNPSFWQFYLTKPGADLSQALAWSDLELIHEAGNVPVNGGKYRMNVTIPADRVGNATLFVRWQRVDVVGEGFYNCSDIVIKNSQITPPVEPTPEPVEPNLIQGNPFIPTPFSLNSATVGDTVHYTVFNAYGEEHASFSLVITAENQHDWDRLLASQVNGWYEANHQGQVFIGRWHEAMSHYMYFKDDLYGNYFNSTDGLFSGEFSITTETSPVDAVISPKVLKAISQAQVEHGDYVVLTPEHSNGEAMDITWLQTSGTPVQTNIGSNHELIIKTGQLPETRQELTFKLVVSNDHAADEAVYSFVVEPASTTPVGPVEPVDPVEPPVDTNAWQATETYTAHDVVTHHGKTWTAQWWTRGEEPGTTGEWGVWR